MIFVTELQQTDRWRKCWQKSIKEAVKKSEILFISLFIPLYSSGSRERLTATLKCFDFFPRSWKNKLEILKYLEGHLKPPIRIKWFDNIKSLTSAPIGSDAPTLTVFVGRRFVESDMSGLFKRTIVR